MHDAALGGYKDSASMLLAEAVNNDLQNQELIHQICFVAELRGTTETASLVRSTFITKLPKWLNRYELY
ncbi:hypothetical protein Enr13x_73940 [Stieleria neptunia]|uniref:Uncharacterized protein n=1 Tax=Stieleria neptunia TaxID=2527979 RepID=A0A518I355_9BACT|nr:hypothetical protein Enr13x_73940 [Stieleria neptunia]